MSFVRTVLGDINPEDLGVCYAHEHIIIDNSFTTYRYSDFLLDSVVVAAEELKAFRRAGGRSMVDSMPCDAGRNVAKLAEVSRKSGVHIVCPTGIHLAKYYDPGHWSGFYSEEVLTRLFVDEISEGIDGNDLNGPVIDRTDHRAGLIKVATDARITPREEKVFAAAAAAQAATGCPILTHTEQGMLAMEQVAMLEKGGVDLSHVCLSHTDRQPDAGYHREVLSTGVRLEYDSAFRWKEPDGNPTFDLVVQLAHEFPDQLMLGMDAARRRYWRGYGGEPGLTFLLDTFKPQLEAEIGEELVRRIFVDNPAGTYLFKSVLSSGT